jgi:hypothetical protein
VRHPLAALGVLLLSLAVPASAAEKPAAPGRVTYEGASIRDPFQWASEPVKAEARKAVGEMTFTLEGLVWRSDRPQAIINGQIVGKGGKIGTAEILDITEKGVKMQAKGQQFWLKPRGKEKS